MQKLIDIVNSIYHNRTPFLIHLDGFSSSREVSLDLPSFGWYVNSDHFPGLLMFRNAGSPCSSVFVIPSSQSGCWYSLHRYFVLQSKTLGPSLCTTRHDCRQWQVNSPIQQTWQLHLPNHHLLLPFLCQGRHSYLLVILVLAINDCEDIPTCQWDHYSYWSCCRRTVNVAVCAMVSTNPQTCSPL